jgi:aminoglycoside phosphotransferase (APT) family kinase protein
MNDPDQEKTDQLAAKFLDYVRHELNDPAIEYDLPPTRVKGGFETTTYKFQLKRAPEDFDKPLVLRLYPEFREPIDAAWMSIVQNALAGQDYPVARAHGMCLDKGVLGGAFFVMDFLPGEPMVTEPLATIPGLLAKTHVALHATDADAVIKTLADQGINEYVFGLDRQFDFLRTSANELPWIRDAADWLMENRPAIPERTVICHGDFHPQNILVQDASVTGVLDWGGFLITDPLMDIANTVWLLSVAYKHLSSPMLKREFGLDIGPGLESVDWADFSRQYLDAYRSLQPLDITDMDYYIVKRSVEALMEGVRGQEVLRHPLIVEDLVDYVHRVTGIRISMPD